MANEEHLARLREGVETWGQWRKSNPDIQPDLRHADLAGADLKYVDLRHADLTGARLGIDLNGVHEQFREHVDRLIVDICCHRFSSKTARIMSLDYSLS
jgi:uncharacterized protein YjbI with pentapeptide repeats